MPSLPLLPPYAVPPSVFRFRAVAQRAARLAIGGDRESALAALMAARIASSCTGPARLPLPVRQARASASRVWFGTLAIPSRARLAAQRVVDASATDDRAALAAGLEELAEVVAPLLDRGAQAELRALARELAQDDGAGGA